VPDLSVLLTVPELASRVLPGVVVVGLSELLVGLCVVPVTERERSVLLVVVPDRTAPVFPSRVLVLLLASTPVFLASVLFETGLERTPGSLAEYDLRIAVFEASVL
jgi:hypothetical protein